MENDGKITTGQESLKIITDMIYKTKTNIAQSSFHLLFWGWLILACSISEYLLYRFTDFNNGWYVWLLTIPGAFVSMFYGFVKGKKATVHTYAEMVYMWTWLGFVLAMVSLFIVQGKDFSHIGKYILVLVGLPTFISGIILKFKPLIFGGIAFWIFAVIASYGNPDVSGISMPVAIIAGYLIPGYMLKGKNSHDAV